MTSKPKKQGHLDGLCGIYSIVNALSFHGQSDARRLFKVCCDALAPSRWPSTLWSGTSLRDLEVMLKACREAFDMDGIAISYPFRSTQPASNRDFWNEFDHLFVDQPTTTCAIIGLETPHYHWLVAKRDGEGLHFIDSEGIDDGHMVPRSDIYAGARRTGSETYRVNRKEVILFKRFA